MQELKASTFDTPLGPMLAIASEEALYLLEFSDACDPHPLTQKLSFAPGLTAPIQSLKNELAQYFAGTLSEFKTPFIPIGSPFQKSVWNQLQKIPYGTTVSYAEQAAAIDKPTAYRAVALANGANPFTLIVPCHRVINSNGKLGGYGGGLWRKKWLLAHEKKYST